MTVVHSISSAADLERGVELARQVLSRGEVVAFPVEHSYVVAVEPFHERAILDLQQARGAVGNALPLLIGTQQMLEGIAKPLTIEVRQLLMGMWPGLLTLVLPSAVPWNLGDGAAGSSGTGVLAVRQPNDPVALALLRHGPLAATTAARAGGQALTADEVIEQLGAVVSLVLDDGPRDPGPASTMISVDRSVLTVVREGAVSRDQLLERAQGLTLTP